jgi:hypothetical protein
MASKAAIVLCGFKHNTTTSAPAMLASTLSLAAIEVAAVTLAADSDVRVKKRSSTYCFARCNPAANARPMTPGPTIVICMRLS